MYVYNVFLAKKEITKRIKKKKQYNIEKKSEEREKKVQIILASSHFDREHLYTHLVVET